MNGCITVCVFVTLIQEFHWDYNTVEVEAFNEHSASYMAREVMA